MVETASLSFSDTYDCADLPSNLSLNSLNYLYGFSCQYIRNLGFASSICWAFLDFTFCIVTATSQGTVSLSPGAGTGVLMLVWSCSQLDQPTDPAEKQSAIFLGQVFYWISLLISLVAQSQVLCQHETGGGHAPARWRPVPSILISVCMNIS